MNLRAKAIEITHSNALGLFAIKTARKTFDFVECTSHTRAYPQTVRSPRYPVTVRPSPSFTVAPTPIATSLASASTKISTTSSTTPIPSTSTASIEGSSPRAASRSSSTAEPTSEPAFSGTPPAILRPTFWLSGKAADFFALLRDNCSSLDVDLRQAGIASSDGTALPSSIPVKAVGPTRQALLPPQPGPQVPMLAIAPLLAPPSSRPATPLFIPQDRHRGRREHSLRRRLRRHQSLPGHHHGDSRLAPPWPAHLRRLLPLPRRLRQRILHEGRKHRLHRRRRQHPRHPHLV